MDTPVASGHSGPGRAVRRSAVAGAALLLLLALVFYGVRIHRFATEGVDVTVFLRTSISEPEQADVVLYLNKLDLIGKIHSLSSDDASRLFVAAYRNVPGLAAATTTRVPGSLNVRLARRQTVNAVKLYLGQLPGVDTVVVPEQVLAAPVLAFDPANPGLVVVFLRPGATAAERAQIMAYLDTLRLSRAVVAESAQDAYGRLLRTNPALAAALSPSVLGEDNQITLTDPAELAEVRAHLGVLPGVARVESAAELFPHA